MVPQVKPFPLGMNQWPYMEKVLSKTVLRCKAFVATLNEMFRSNCSCARGILICGEVSISKKAVFVAVKTRVDTLSLTRKNNFSKRPKYLCMEKFGSSSLLSFARRVKTREDCSCSHGLGGPFVRSFAL